MKTSTSQDRFNADAVGVRKKRKKKKGGSCEKKKKKKERKRKGEKLFR